MSRIWGAAKKYELRPRLGKLRCYRRVSHWQLWPCTRKYRMVPCDFVGVSPELDCSLTPSGIDFESPLGPQFFCFPPIFAAGAAGPGVFVALFRTATRHVRAAKCACAGQRGSGDAGSPELFGQGLQRLPAAICWSTTALRGERSSSIPQWFDRLR